MQLSPRKINLFLLFKLPAAYFTGVRVAAISGTACTTRVRYRWINQNPFKSMFWAVQGMAAELSTGALVMGKIKMSGRKISMLVISNKASFHKKAKGKITFTCNDGAALDEVIREAIATGQGQTVWMKAEGKNSTGELVSIFEFEWTLKLK